MVSKKNWYGILALALVFGMALAGCEHNARGIEGGGDSDAPETITGFYGVTTDGKIIEIILTSSNGTSQNARAIAESGTYVIKIDGFIVSEGSFTNNGNTLTFASTDNSTVTPVISSDGELTSITVVADNTSYSGKTIESKDHYYIGTLLTKYTKDQFTAVVSGKTLGELANICGSDSNFRDSEGVDGRWDELVEIFTLSGYPASYFTNMASKLTEDTLLIWDWTEKSSFDQEQADGEDKDYPNFILFVSRMPIDDLMNCKL